MLVLASLQVILNFFFTFSKNGSVGRWETKHFMGMALSVQKLVIKQLRPGFIDIPYTGGILNRVYGILTPQLELSTVYSKPCFIPNFGISHEFKGKFGYDGFSFSPQTNLETACNKDKQTNYVTLSVADTLMMLMTLFQKKLRTLLNNPGSCA